jgi:hypothetical protein
MLRVEAATLDTGQRVKAMVARFATDRRIMAERGYRVGDEVRAVLTKARVIEHHRKAHLLGQMVVAQVDGFESETSHSALKRLQVASGVLCELESIDAAPVVEALLSASQAVLGPSATDMLRAVLPKIEKIQVTVAQSLAFDRMSQEEFAKFYTGICTYLALTYWPSLTAEQVEAQAELFDSQHGN